LACCDELPNHYSIRLSRGGFVGFGRSLHDSRKGLAEGDVSRWSTAT